MWPWPMGAADHTGRQVDRRHITDWTRWGCLRHRWTERRSSWCAILFVSTLADRLNPTSPRATLRPPLAYCVTEFGRQFVRPTRDNVRVNYEAAVRPPRRRAICSARHDSSRISAGMECERARRLGGQQIYSAGLPLQLLTGDSYGRPTTTLQGKA